MTFQLKDEAHYVVYRRLDLTGMTHTDAYDLATAITNDLMAQFTLRHRATTEGDE